MLFTKDGTTQIYFFWLKWKRSCEAHCAWVRVRFTVMVWLEGGQGEVRGACPPPPPNTDRLGP